MLERGTVQTGRAPGALPEEGRLGRLARRFHPGKKFPGLGGDDARRYSLEPARLLPGNLLEPLINGEEAFPAMLEAIAGARAYVHLETYILADDAIGRRFAEALLERARAGVSVRLLFDSVGSLSLPDEFVESLRSGGVEVVEFRPLRKFFFRAQWTRRDHRKILVVDGRVGFTGGLNVSEDYASSGPSSKGWRDTHVAVRGPVVAQLEALFRATWHRAGGSPYPLEVGARDELDSAASENDSLAAAVASDGGRRSVIRRHYLHAIVRARESIFIANAYFVPDRGLLRALKRAARRGVRVALVVPAESDVPVVQRASEHLYGALLRRGVEIHQWPRTHMHAKTAVVDGTWSVVGSYNLDSVSLFQNNEVVVECIDASFGARMVAQFERDVESCVRLSRDWWRRRPLTRRVAEWTAYQFNRWL